MKLFRKTKSSNQLGRRRATKSDSPAVFSYYARGASPTDDLVARTEQTARHARFRPKFGHFPTYIALVVICIAAISVILLNPSPRVVLVNTPGSVQREAQVYQDAIEALWKQNILNRSKLTISTTALAQNIQSQFGELEGAHIQLPLLGQRATVVLTPTKPLLQIVSNNGSFYVNANGTVMARIEDVNKNQLDGLPTVRDESGIQAEQGKNILAPSEVVFIDTLTRHLITNNVALSSITLPRVAARQADVRLEGEQYYIKFSFDSNPQQAVGTLLAIQKKLATDNIKPKEYIDVRVEEKVFYK